VWSVCQSSSTDSVSENCLVNISSTSSVLTSGSRYYTLTHSLTHLSTDWLARYCDDGDSGDDDDDGGGGGNDGDGGGGDGDVLCSNLL